MIENKDLWKIFNIYTPIQCIRCKFFDYNLKKIKNIWIKVIKN